MVVPARIWQSLDWWVMDPTAIRYFISLFSTSFKHLQSDFSLKKWQLVAARHDGLYYSILCDQQLQARLFTCCDFLVSNTELVPCTRFVEFV